MIGFTADYPIGSVYLFQQDHAHKLVRECHVREAQMHIAFF